MSQQTSNTEDPKVSAIAAAARAWGVTTQGLAAVDISIKLPSLNRFQPFMVVDTNRRKMVVAMEPGGTKLHFGEPAQVVASDRQKGRLEALNALLAGEKIDLPTGMPATELADLARMTLETPGGLVGSSKLLAQVEPPDDPDAAASGAKQKPKPIDMWISRRPADGRALFTAHCKDPEVSQDGDSWKLSFFFFTPAGGVEAWTLTGRRQSIDGAEHREALPAQTFLWPYA